MALPVRVAAGGDDDLTGGQEAHDAVAVEGELAATGRHHPGRGVPAHLDVGGHADAQVLGAPGRALLRLLDAEVLVVDQFQRPVQRRLVVARVEGHLTHRRVDVLERRDEVDAPDVGRVLAHLEGEFVDGPLDGVGRLGAAGAAVGVRGWKVGVDADDLAGVGRHVVAAVVVHPAEHRDARGEQLAVGAEVTDQLDADGGDLAGGIGGDLDVLQLAAAVDHRDTALGAGLDPADRAGRAGGRASGRCSPPGRSAAWSRNRRRRWARRRAVAAPPSRAGWPAACAAGGPSGWRCRGCSPRGPGPGSRPRARVSIGAGSRRCCTCRCFTVKAASAKAASTVSGVIDRSQV